MMATPSIPFDPVSDIPSLEGKVILITGANAGLGKRSALELAKHNPSQIWVTARDNNKGSRIVEEIKIQSPEVVVSFLRLDLSSFDSIRHAAKRFLASASRLDILFLNAGIFGHPAGLTTEGYEIHMGTNHLGHALLLQLLTPLLLQTAAIPKADVRVISLTSIGYRMGSAKEGIQFELLKRADGAPAAEFYVQSKIANLLYAKEIAKRHPQFKTIPIHPGEVQTELFSREPGDDQIRYLQENVVPKHTKGVDEGVKNQLWAATADNVQSGEYYEPVGVSGVATSWANDKNLAAKLWEWTEKELQAHQP